MRLFLRAGMLAAGLSLAACASVVAPRAANSDSYADHLVGRVANLRQDYDAASDRYLSALSRDPGNAALIEGAVTASLASGDIDQARRAARMSSGADLSAHARLLRAADHLAGGRTRQAIAELNATEGAAAEELSARMLLVWANAVEGRVDDVVADLAPLASIRPYGSLFLYQQAMALDFAGRNDEALVAYAAGADGGMVLPPAVERRADLLVRTGDVAAALAIVREEANRSNPQLTAAAARIEAGQPISQRLTAARGAAVALYGLAAILVQENDTTNALANLSLALVLDPELDAAKFMFAQTQSNLGHIDLARAALQRIEPRSAYSSSARVMEAWLLVDEGRKDEALALVAASAETGDFRAKRALADMYRNLMRYDEAEAIYNELIESHPQDWRLFFARGAARERQDRWFEAQADFRRALELSPEQPDVLNYLGYSMADRGENLDEALDMVMRAFQQRPSSGAILDSVGWVYYRMGNYPQALVYLETAIQVDPTDPTLNDHLGDIYWRLDRRIEARFQWQRALAAEPDDAEAIQAKLTSGLPALPPAQSARR